MSKLQTSDLYLSAFLKTRGAPLARSISNGSRVSFEFEAQNLNDLVVDYYANSPVGVANFVLALRTLRDLCRNTQREGQ